MKCRYCKKEIKKEESYNPKPRMYYCDENCYNATKKETVEENVEVVKKSPRVILTDYILDLYLKNGWNKESINWKLIMSQLKNMMDENKDWKYSGIKYVLQYMDEVKNVRLLNTESNGSVLTLVPYYWIEARDYYILTTEINKKTKEIELGKIIVSKASKNRRDRKYMEVKF